jgi:hypothetical protein
MVEWMTSAVRWTRSGTHVGSCVASSRGRAAALLAGFGSCQGQSHPYVLTGVDPWGHIEQVKGLPRMSSYLPSPESLANAQASITSAELANRQRQRVASAGRKIKTGDVLQVANSSIGIAIALFALVLLPFFWPGSVVLLLLLLVAK